MTRRVRTDQQDADLFRDATAAGTRLLKEKPEILNRGFIGGFHWELRRDGTTCRLHNAVLNFAVRSRFRAGKRFSKGTQE
jgi:hypothetical protein